MRLIALLLFVSFSASAQFGNFKQVRLLNNTDSTGIANVGIIRYDPITGKYRFWNSLTSQWFTYGTGTGGGAVSSVFGRTGAVVAATNDYTPLQVGAWGLTGTSTITTPTIVGDPFFQGNVLVGPSGATITSNTRADIRGIPAGNILRLANLANTTKFTFSDEGRTTQAMTATNTAFTAYALSGSFNPSSGTNGATYMSVVPTWATSGSYTGNGIGYDYNPSGSFTGTTELAFRSTSANAKFLLGGTTITSGSVMADFQSTTRGILVPRVTNIASITTPVNGMVAYDAATDLWNFRQAGSWVNLGGGSGIGGSTGATDNTILRADGTGGSTLQNSAVSINDSGTITIPDGQSISSTSGTSALQISNNSSLLSAGNSSIVVGNSSGIQVQSTLSAGSGNRLLDLTALTNSVSRIKIEHQTSGTPAVGIGSGVNFLVETAAGNVETGASIEAITTDVTGGSEDFSLSFKTMDAGSAITEKLKISGTTTTLGGSSTIGSLLLTTDNVSNDAPLYVEPQGTLYLRSISGGDVSIVSGNNFLVNANLTTTITSNNMVINSDEGIAIEVSSSPPATGGTNAFKIFAKDVSSSAEPFVVNESGVEMRVGTISGSHSQVGAATTTFTVTIGDTMANTTYKVNVTPTNALSSALFYVTNKTTTTFDVMYLAGLTGSVTFDWILVP